MLAIPAMSFILKLDLASCTTAGVFAFLPPSALILALFIHGSFDSFSVSRFLAFAAWTSSVRAEYGSCSFDDFE